jgi:hypothetical protein
VNHFIQVVNHALPWQESKVEFLRNLILESSDFLKRYLFRENLWLQRRLLFSLFLQNTAVDASKEVLQDVVSFLSCHQQIMKVRSSFNIFRLFRLLIILYRMKHLNVLLIVLFLLRNRRRVEFSSGILFWMKQPSSMVYI